MNECAYTNEIGHTATMRPGARETMNHDRHGTLETTRKREDTMSDYATCRDCGDDAVYCDRCGACETCDTDCVCNALEEASAV